MNLVNTFTKFVNIFLGMLAMIIFYIFLPESSITKSNLDDLVKL